MSKQFITLKEYAEMIKGRLNDRADMVMAVTGMPGTGKSTFQIELGRRVDPNFSIARNLVFDPQPKEIIKKITHELPAGAAVGLDEGIRLANSRKSMDPLNVFVMEYFALCRKDYKLIMLCLPVITQLDKGIRDERVIHWVEIVQRGLACVFARSRIPGEDPLGTSNLKRHMRECFPEKKYVDFTTEDLVRGYARHDNFAFFVKFNPMPPELEREYEETAAKMRKSLKPPKDTSRDRAKLYKMVMTKMIADIYTSGVVADEICRRYQLSAGFVQAALKAEGVRKIDRKAALKQLKEDAGEEPDEDIELMT